MKLMLYSIMVIALTACGSQTEEISHIDSVAETGARWDDPTNIPVCFVDSRSSQQVDRDLIQSNITRNYNTRTEGMIAFTGWGTCSNSYDSPEIRIKIGPPVPAGNGYVITGCSSIGPYPEAGFSGCRFTFFSRPYNMYISTDYIGTDVHEFGHALGLRHEHARTDSPEECQTEEVVTDGEDIVSLNGNEGQIIYLTEDYDEDSIMSYCNNSADLSQGDLDGLMKLYYGGI